MKNLSLIIGLLHLLSCNSAVSDSSKKRSSQIERFDSFPSRFIDARTIEVWLPSSYENGLEHSVLYMHDGQMLFDEATTWNGQSWDVDETIDSLIQAEKIKASIVVGIYNSPSKRHQEFFPQKALSRLDYKAAWTQDSLRLSEVKTFSSEVIADDYLKFIVQELKPFIDKNYSTFEGTENTFIMGSSMGGLISMYAICEYPEVFGAAACMSTHWPELYTNNNNPYPPAIQQYLEQHAPPAENHKLYFDYGTHTLDSLYEIHQLKVDDILRSKSYTKANLLSLKFEGAAHTENDWSQRLQVPLQFLLGK